MPSNRISLYVSFPPHVHAAGSVSGIMYEKLIALAPAGMAAFYYFRVGALKVMLAAVAAAILSEALMQKFLKRELTVLDGSAALSGLLLAFLLPPTTPWWVVVIGACAMIVIGKQIFGGLGNNPFNDAMVGWVILSLSWPERISSWVEPVNGWVPDPPLSVFKFDGLAAFHDYGFSYMDLFLGNQAGGIGAVCVLALLLGGLYLLARRVISWHIPVGVLGAVAAFSGILWVLDSAAYLNPLYELLGGSTILTAFFIATDPVTSPVTRWGKLIFGLLCGSLIMLIRIWGLYPDGAAFAVLLANAGAPLLNKLKPRPYGREEAVA